MCAFVAEVSLAPVWHDEDSGSLMGIVAHRYPGSEGISMPGRFSPDLMEGMQVQIIHASSTMPGGATSSMRSEASGGEHGALGRLMRLSLCCPVCQVAVSWVSSQVRPLCQWLGGGKRTVLWRPGEETISIYCTNSHVSLSGRSVAAAFALSLVCMLVKRPASRSVAVTGNLDLAGNILEVEGLQGKLRACQRHEVDLLLVPAASLAALSIYSLPADLRAYARRALRGVKTMTDVIRACIVGQCLPAHLSRCPSHPPHVLPVALVCPRMSRLPPPPAPDVTTGGAAAGSGPLLWPVVSPPRPHVP